jgi:hypothetical protein
MLSCNGLSLPLREPDRGGEAVAGGRAAPLDEPDAQLPM